MTFTVLPNQTIGILGGGQLGRMMAIAAKQMGYRIAVQDPGEHAPCTQVADIHIKAPLDDLEGAKKLAQVSDVITYEFENVNLELARFLEETGKLPQGSRLLAITQNRGREKAAFEEAGVPYAPYVLLEEQDDVERAVNQIGFPCVLKTLEGGYDGKGQYRLDSLTDVEGGQRFLQEKKACILESWLPFTKEISVIMTRGQEGQIEVFPIPENHHQDQILRESVVPASVDTTILDQAKEEAIRLASSLKFVGTFAVEMFVVEGEIYMNEMAPRPHNSGHYTIEACNVSQFEQHIRAVCGLPLLRIDTPYAAVMQNILGEEAARYAEDPVRFSDLHVHLYGKDAMKPKRKMGHLTSIASTVQEAKQKLEKRQEVSG